MRLAGAVYGLAYYDLADQMVTLLENTKHKKEAYALLEIIITNSFYFQVDLYKDRLDLCAHRLGYNLTIERDCISLTKAPFFNKYARSGTLHYIHGIPYYHLLPAWQRPIYSLTCFVQSVFCFFGLHLHNKLSYECCKHGKCCEKLP
jgi:hypothetical protein